MSNTTTTNNKKVEYDYKENMKKAKEEIEVPEMTIENVEKRISEIPTLIEQLRIEFNQLLGWKAGYESKDKNV
jgi:DNA repair ATPase RecN